MVTFLTGRPPLLISSARATKPALIRAPTAARVTALHIHDFIARILSNRASACRRGGSNPYTFRYRILSPARLPIPPLLRGLHGIVAGLLSYTIGCVFARRRSDALIRTAATLFAVLVLSLPAFAAVDKKAELDDPVKKAVSTLIAEANATFQEKTSQQITVVRPHPAVAALTRQQVHAVLYAMNGKLTGNPYKD